MKTIRSKFLNHFATIFMFAAILLSVAAVFGQVPVGDTTKPKDTSTATAPTETLFASKVPVKDIEKLIAIDDPEKKSRPISFRPNLAKTDTETDVSTKAEPAKPTKQQAAADGWEFAFAPYLFATSMTGTIGARGRTAEIDISFSEIFDHLDIGLMGAFEAKKGKFVIFNDLVWAKLEEERDTPGGLYSTAKLGVNMFIFDPEAGYRVFESKAGSFTVLGGVRIMSIETNLDFRAGTLPAFDVSQRKTWGTPVAGGHGMVNLSPKIFLATKFDIGGGFGADLTGQFYGGGGFRVSPRIALIGGYRYMKTDYDDDSGFVFNTSMSGLQFGARFAF